jgi:repressor LexA
MSRDTSLTTVQEETLALIQRYILKYGKSPTITELQKDLRLRSIRSVTQRLEALEKKGFIARDRFQHRSIKILKNVSSQYLPSDFIAVPVIASAGCDAVEVFAQDEFGEFIAVDRKLLGRSTSIAAIKAIGDSMIDAGIHNGDFVIVEVTDQAESGDRVVAVIGNMAVIKRFESVEGSVILHPENKEGNYSPIVIDEDNAKIFGKVLSIIPGTEWVDDIKIEYYPDFKPRWFAILLDMAYRDEKGEILSRMRWVRDEMAAKVARAEGNEVTDDQEESIRYALDESIARLEGAKRKMRG